MQSFYKPDSHLLGINDAPLNLNVLHIKCLVLYLLAHVDVMNRDFQRNTPGEGVLAMMAYTHVRGGSAQKGQGISLVDVYKRVRESVIWVCKRSQKD